MKHASLFSGIGGPEIAAAMMGWENVFHCEINPFGRKVLEHWFPNSDSYEDITKTDFTRYKGQVDVLTGGFPCQPFSYAGKRGGQADDRYLWPEMLRVIDEVRPTWVVGENVAGITTMVESCEITDMGGEVSLFEEDNGVHRFRAEYAFTIERICRDLESKGYSVQPMLIPACAVGAPHKRDRVFIIAYSSGCGSESYPQDGRAKSNRCNKFSQPGKWREQAQLDNGFSTFPRLADNTNCRNDMRESRKNESEGGEERISERHVLRKPGESDNVRSEVHALTSDSDGGAGWSEETECGGQEHLSSRQEGRSILCDYKRPGASWNASDSNCERPQRRDNCNKEEHRGAKGGSVGFLHCDKMLPGNRWEGFPSVSPVHRGNDGLPFDVDSLTIPFSKWRNESLKAYGNAIVPQVMYRIFQCIEDVV